MQIPSLPQANQESTVLLSPKNVLALQTGEIVQAEVLTVTDTAVAIRMKNSIIEAKSGLPLKEGEVLSLLVEQAGQDIQLRVLPGNGESPGSINNVILSALDTLQGLKPASDDIQMLVSFITNASQGLREALPGLDVLEKLMPSLENLSGNVLESAVEDSGVFFETKLRLLLSEDEQDNSSVNRKIQDLVNNDMKGALLSLKEALGDRDLVGRLLQSGVQTDKLTAAVDNLLKNTELLQLQSKLTDTLQVFVPFVWQELKNGELIFRESGRGQPGEESYLCTINLDLERIGRLSAGVLLQAGKVYVDVIAENGKFSEILQENKEQLTRQFEAVGIRLGGFSIRQESRIDPRSSREGGLNIRI